MSCLMTKPTLNDLCAQRRLKSTWASAQSDQSLCCPLSAWRNIGSSATHWAHCEDSDQTGQMPRLIWVFAGHTDHFVGFFMRQLKYEAHLNCLFGLSHEYLQYMSLVMRKPVFGVYDQGRLKLTHSATETSWGLEILGVETRGILSRPRTTKALIRLRGCTGWSAPLLFAYGKNRFSHNVWGFMEWWSRFSSDYFVIQYMFFHNFFILVSAV